MKKTFNSERYCFSDFTLDHYKELIEFTKIKYKFCFYHDFEKDARCVFWRHDVDHSYNNALNLAKIENELGVKSTYFVLISGEYYNIFDIKVKKVIEQIIDLGHDIALHFDHRIYNIKTVVEFNEKLNFEKKIINTLFTIDIKSFSFHQPDKFALSLNENYYSDLINVYSSFFYSSCKYCSDSNGYWIYERMMDVIKNSNSKYLHLLTHPVWWTNEIMSPWEKIKTTVHNNSNLILENYLYAMKIHNRKNIDWE